MIVFIGAGPTGSFMALALHQAGISNIIIVDHRAGEYTRVGYLDRTVLEELSRQLNISINIPTAFIHIKDFERILEEKIKNTNGIEIIKKKFLRLHEDSSNPGVVVADAEGNNVYIAADYVFDCTGSSRQVINAVNRAHPSNPPFTLHSFAKPPFPTHLLAYVKMDTQHFDLIKNAKDFELYKGDPLLFARNLLKLRALGWQKLRFPELYPFLVNFQVNKKRNKACLYLNIPNNLSKENEEKWFQTVLESYAGRAIDYRHLPPSKKYSSKQKFIAFNIDATVIETLVYKEDKLTIAPLGDALISPYFIIGNGISGMMRRARYLTNAMTILNGELQDFNQQTYIDRVADPLLFHIEQISRKMKQEKIACIKEISNAESYLNKAIAKSLDVTEQNAFSKLLEEEILPRKSYTEGVLFFTLCHDIENKLLLSTETNKLFSYVKSCHQNLEKAFNELPPQFEEEKEHSENLLKLLPDTWLQLGRKLYANNQYRKSIAAYQYAIEICHLPPFAQEDVLKESFLYMGSSYLGLAWKYNGEKLFSKAIIAAEKSLEICEEAEREEAIFILTAALCSQAQIYLKENNITEAHNNYTKATSLPKIKNDETFINQIKEMIEELQDNLLEESSIKKLQVWGLFAQEEAPLFQEQPLENTFTA